MPGDIYDKLREQLDQYSCGFPSTKSGVEIKILEKLFTEREAKIFLSMGLKLESLEELSQRLDGGPEAIAATLQQMSEKGTVFRLSRDTTVRYAAVPYVLGIYEFQLGRMDNEMAGLYEQYFEEAFLNSITVADPLLRPIPVKRSVEMPYPVATYDDSREIVKSQKLIVLAECICRRQQGLLNKNCGKPLEVCLLFGAWGQHYIDMGMARKITVEEALKVLDQAEEAGLVTQPSNTQNSAGICNCCGECCGILRGLNKLPRPAEVVISNYFVVVNPELCNGCETCLDRCQMGAIVLNDDETAEINLDRCIGCGLCVTTCPGEALLLEIKPEAQRRIPPKTSQEVMITMAKKRAKSLVPLSFKPAS